ncbi:AAA family ATPase [Promicromonospora kroppenstedtii]|uniref:AAA family ATPase n=1 Tax=Promicromonospora kroppenstedtii TaxID=440482 RepID=UPI00068879AA|nr:ATP-binding protein [Promicromonospora kroppenstedtii]
MILLRFRVENHRSIRDEAELSLVRPSLTTARPKDGDWVGATTRVAGVYGANASGKSTVVDAVEFFQAVVVSSATSWSHRRRLPQQPFRLTARSAPEPSAYSVDFVLDDVRYQYGFEITENAVRQEWLYDYPSTKHRVLFEREGNEFKFGRALVGSPRLHAAATGSRALFLSKAAGNGHGLLGRLFAAFADQIVVADFSEQDRNRRLQQITEGIAEGEISLNDVKTLLRVADIGITDVGIDESEIPEDVREFSNELTELFHRHLEPGPAESGEGTDESGPAGSTPAEHPSVKIELIRRALMFQHAGRNGVFPLPLGSQSTGTLSWLSLALPALTILRSGGLLIVDEIDASLHPQLSQVILRMFKDPDYNHTGAQLIFTTHDTFLLSAQSDSMLTPEETWFTEKDGDGATSLFSLAEFPTRPDQNFSKRYLDGRYGAIPRTARSFLVTLLDEETKVRADA